LDTRPPRDLNYTEKISKHLNFGIEFHFLFFIALND